MRRDQFRVELCKWMPPIEEGVLYISNFFELAQHKCPCGCGHDVVTPLILSEWKLTYADDVATLRPSILNAWCGSHYFITNNRVEWL